GPRSWPPTSGAASTTKLWPLEGVALNTMPSSSSSVPAIGSVNCSLLWIFLPRHGGAPSSLYPVARATPPPRLAPAARLGWTTRPLSWHHACGGPDLVHDRHRRYCPPRQGELPCNPRHL